MEKSDFKVLVAEDDEIVRDVIVKAISSEGYSVVVAHDGLAAIRLLRLEDIKLVITDLKMPGADGMEVLRNAKRISPKIAVVVLTAYGTIDTTLRVIKEGAYDYALKPFMIQELLLVVRNAYDRAVLIRENEELSRHLRETYRNLETIKTFGSSNSTAVKLDTIERIERLKELNIISASEADILRETIIPGKESTK